MVFKQHKSIKCPVNSSSFVIYQTENDDNELSHIHLPIRAGLLNWGADLTNRISKYCVVELTEKGEEIYNAIGIQKEPTEVIEQPLEEEGITI